MKKEEKCIYVGFSYFCIDSFTKECIYEGHRRKWHCFSLLQCLNSTYGKWERESNEEEGPEEKVRRWSGKHKHSTFQTERNTGVKVRNLFLKVITADVSRDSRLENLWVESREIEEMKAQNPGTWNLQKRNSWKSRIVPLQKPCVYSHGTIPSPSDYLTQRVSQGRERAICKRSASFVAG